MYISWEKAITSHPSVYEKNRAFIKENTLKLFDWRYILGTVLIAISVAVYALHYFVFRDPHHIFIFFVGDVAFVFVEALLVTMILNGLLENRERRTKLKKLNILIGVFYNKMGTRLLQEFITFDREKEKTCQTLLITTVWTEKQLFQVRKQIENTTFTADPLKGNLEALRQFISLNHDYLIRILENPTISEHGYFTNMVWAICHIGDELEYRKELGILPHEDYEHLSGDINRAYTQLIAEWLTYMKHLKKEYPYLFSLACRINPFQPNARTKTS
ncbi:MAG: hypothetical protein HW390_3535 [Candidatus Brocadiaceae bacterium]|nr:hypothetical protein [Candidatus Brocadiaceae bacterium]